MGQKRGVEGFYTSTLYTLLHRYTLVFIRTTPFYTSVEFLVRCKASVEFLTVNLDHKLHLK
jgi:hypothetical protein